MKITWFGTASILIESSGHKILFDPYLRKLNKRLSPFPLEKLHDTEAIFITHPHLDHYGDIRTVLEHTSCPVYTNARGLELASVMRFDSARICGIEFGNEFKYGDLIIQACRGKHVKYDKACVKNAIKRALKGHIINGLKLNRLNNRMSIDLEADVFAFYLRENEKTALILGSANKPEHVDYPKVDLLIYPYQGRSDMLDYSLKFVKDLSPKTVLTDHFDDAFPPLTMRMNVEEFKQKLEGESSVKVIIPNENEPIEDFG